MLAILIIEAVALLFLGVLVVGLLRSHAEILRRLHEMGEGLDEVPDRSPRATIRTAAADGSAAGPAHDLSGETLDGEAVAVGLIGAPTNALLAFLSGTCYTCEPFWEAFGGGVEVPGDARVIVVVQEGDNTARLRRLAGADLLVIASDQAWQDYEVPGSPHFVYVDGPAGRVVGEGTASTWDQIHDLVEHATTGNTRRATVDLLPPGRDNAERIDRELLAAGIGPGHPSLYPDASPSADPPAAG